MKLRYTKDEFSILPVYGGKDDMYEQQDTLKNKSVDFVVGTIGRVRDHIMRGNISLSALQTIVIDQVDEMVTLNFKDDIDFILQELKAQRQKMTQHLFFSASLPN